MKRNIKGFYTLEAAIFLPLVILAVLSLGYFMKVEGTWENCIHGALDESAKISSKAYDSIRAAAVTSKVNKRIKDDNDNLTSSKVYGLMMGYSDGTSNQLISYKLHAQMDLKLPLGFGRSFDLDGGIKFRGFIGLKNRGTAMGAEGLERWEAENPVYVFPYSGERYHHESCTYVKAKVEKVVLTTGLKEKHSGCGLCDSYKLPPGSTVYCFDGEETAYHRGTCSSIKRHTIVIDKTDAIKRGYSPCSKCGGG